MTQQEAQSKTNEKIKAVEVMLKQLNLRAVAFQVVNKNGIIENIVYYIDSEDYKIEAPREEEKKDDKTTNL